MKFGRPKETPIKTAAPELAHDVIDTAQPCTIKDTV